MGQPKKTIEERLDQLEEAQTLTAKRVNFVLYILYNESETFAVRVRARELLYERTT